VFVKKFNNSPSAVQLEIVAGIQKIEWQKVDNTDTVNDMSIISKMLETVSNVLKTKHDTVKNSIGNIR
jgi:putative salt-induced outer membrane protein YdiY